MIVKCQCCKERECTNGSLVAEEVSTSFEIKNYVKETTIIPKIQIYIQNNPYYYEDFCEENLKGSLNFFELLFKLTKKIMIYLKKATVEKRSPYIQLILARKPTRLKDIAQTMMFRNI